MSVTDSKRDCGLVLSLPSYLSKSGRRQTTRRTGCRLIPSIALQIVGIHYRLVPGDVRRRRGLLVDAPDRVAELAHDNSAEFIVGSLIFGTSQSSWLGCPG
jgi:hypothetical protein